MQENQYDPYGLDLAGLSRSATPQNKYSWNGKERQDDFGLNWLDHGWRFYDPTLGRWVVTDPDGEEGDQEGWTSYQFGLDNAVRYNDLDGRKPGDPLSTGQLAVSAIQNEIAKAQYAVESTFTGVRNLYNAVGRAGREELSKWEGKAELSVTLGLQVGDKINILGAEIEYDITVANIEVINVSLTNSTKGGFSASAKLVDTKAVYENGKWKTGVKTDGAKFEQKTAVKAAYKSYGLGFERSRSAEVNGKRKVSNLTSTNKGPIIGKGATSGARTSEQTQHGKSNKTEIEASVSKKRIVGGDAKINFTRNP